jgi:hypothetical protein
VQIGIGLPAPIPGVSGKLVLDWARKADAGPFSSLGIIDRIVYPNNVFCYTPSHIFTKE